MHRPHILSAYEMTKEKDLSFNCVLRLSMSHIYMG